MNNFLCFFLLLIISNSSFAALESVAPTASHVECKNACDYSGWSQYTQCTIRTSDLSCGQPTPSYQNGVLVFGEWRIRLYNMAAGDCPTPSSGAAYTFNPSTQMCERGSNPVCDAGGIKNSSYGKGFTVPGAVGDTLCVDSCSYNVINSVSSSTGTYAEIGRSASATNCTTVSGLVGKPATPTLPPTPATCLEQGQSYITMNSVTRCVGAGTAGAAPVTVTQTSQNAVSGVAGATSIKTSDLQEGDNVTRTTTTTNASGVSSTNTTTAPKSAFCETSPEAAMCKEKKGSANGGDNCTAPPSCDGDAILCAQLQQTWSARCDGQQSHSIATLGENVLNGIDNLVNPPNPLNPEVIPIGSLVTTEIFTNTTCPAPVPMNFSVMGVSRSMSFDLTPFCTLGGVLGILNVLGSLFFAGRMIAGGL